MLYTVVNTDNGRVAQTFIQLSEQEAYDLNREAFYNCQPSRFVPVHDDDNEVMDAFAATSFSAMEEAMKKAGIA